MDCLTFEITGRKVIKKMNGEKKDFQCFGSGETAEAFVERECLVYAHRIPRVRVVIDRK